MAVPKKRQSQRRTGMRRANHDRVDAPNTIICPSCGELKRPHRVCGSCGTYNGRKVVVTVGEE